MTFDIRAVGLFVAISSIAVPARAQQVTITIGGYGQPQQQVAAPPSVPTQQGTTSTSGYGAYAGPVAFAQMAAYGRYMQYLSVLNYQSTHNGALPTSDAKEYFTNGAAATTVPSAGPGSAYFNNGSEATVIPPASAPQAPPPPPPSQQPPGQSPWVVVYQNPNPPPTSPAPPPAVAPAPPSEAPDTRVPVVAMSFEDWLQSMGLDNSDTATEATPELTSAEVETAPIAEPAALAYDVRQRVAYALPEKPRARAVSHASGWGTLTGITGAFAAGLILGGLAMLRLRDRSRKTADAASVPPPQS